MLYLKLNRSHSSKPKHLTFGLSIISVKSFQGQNAADFWLLYWKYVFQKIVTCYPLWSIISQYIIWILSLINNLPIFLKHSRILYFAHNQLNFWSKEEQLTRKFRIKTLASLQSWIFLLLSKWSSPCSPQWPLRLDWNPTEMLTQGVNLIEKKSSNLVNHRQNNYRLP